jgi:hypothetical protein
MFAVCCVLAAVLALFGCSGKSTRESPTEQALVTQEQIESVSGSSPEGVVLQLWRTVQVGDVSSAFAFYHSKVRGAISPENMTGALAQQRSSLALLRPRILSGSRTPMGFEVIVSATSGGSGVGVQSFLLRRDLEGWRVAFDTLLGDALPTYVESRVHERVAPGSNTPSPVAQQAANRIAAVYRTLFASELRSTRIPRR